MSAQNQDKKLPSILDQQPEGLGSKAPISNRLTPSPGALQANEIRSVAGAGDKGAEKAESQSQASPAVLQAKEMKAAADPETTKQVAKEGLSGTPQKLPHLDKVQHAFAGHDLSNVKAYVGGPAAKAAKEMGASAYATGDKVAFKEQPDVKTVAHEAAHVVQQREGVSLKGGVGEKGDPYEKVADAAAEKVVQGKPTSGLLGAQSSPNGMVQAQTVQLGGDAQPDFESLQNAQVKEITGDDERLRIIINRGSDHGVSEDLLGQLYVGSTNQVVKFKVASTTDDECEAIPFDVTKKDLGTGKLRIEKWFVAEKIREGGLKNVTEPKGGYLTLYNPAEGHELNRGKKDGVTKNQKGKIEYQYSRNDEWLTTEIEFKATQVQPEFSIVEFDKDEERRTSGYRRKNWRVIRWDAPPKEGESAPDDKPKKTTKTEDNKPKETTKTEPPKEVEEQKEQDNPKDTKKDDAQEAPDSVPANITGRLAKLIVKLPEIGSTYSKWKEVKNATEQKTLSDHMDSLREECAYLIIGEGWGKEEAKYNHYIAYMYGTWKGRMSENHPEWDSFDWYQKNLSACKQQLESICEHDEYDETFKKTMERWRDGIIKFNYAGFVALSEAATAALAK